MKSQCLSWINNKTIVKVSCQTVKFKTAYVTFYENV